jgi:hypothetical protein
MPDAVRGRGHHRRWTAASRTERLTIRLTPLGIYIVPAAVPEPTSLSLLALGLGGLRARRWRQRRRGADRIGVVS